MTDWCGSRGQVKWLTDVVMQWCSNAVVESKSNDWTGVVAVGNSNNWLMLWQGASQMTDWYGGRGKSNDWTDVVMQYCSDVVVEGKWGQVKWWTNAVMRQCSDTVAEDKSNDWLMWFAVGKSNDWTDVVARGKSNGWLMRWYSNALCPSTSASASSDWWCGGSGQVKWLTDTVIR